MQGGSMQIAITVLIATLEYARFLVNVSLARLIIDVSRRSFPRGISSATARDDGFA